MMNHEDLNDTPADPQQPGREPAEHCPDDEETTDIPAAEIEFIEPAQDEAAGGDGLEALRTKAGERDDYYDRWLRAHADFANLQQRSRRQILAASQQGVQKFAHDLLPVLDDFERALKTAHAGHDFEQLIHGVRIAEDAIHSALEKHGVEPIPAVGEAFDPNLHEAIATTEDPDAADGTITEEVRRGYRLGDRIIRASQVIVVRNPAPAPAGGEPETAEQEPEPAGDDPAGNEDT